MENVISIRFYWEGNVIETSQKYIPMPSDNLEAETAAWAIVRKWFMDNNRTIPEFVRNVSILNKNEYHWAILPLNSSADSVL